MKKISVLLCALILALSFTACSNNKPSGNTEPQSDMYKFAVISDSQLIPNPQSYTSVNLKAAFNAIKKENVDMVVFSGDIVEYGTEEAYEYYKSLENQYFPTSDTNRPEFLYVMGNHETYRPAGGAQNYDESAERFEQFLGQERNVLKKLGDYYFIGISTESTELDGYFSPETIAFAKEKIEESIAEDPTRPVFISAHMAPADTVIWTEGGANANAQITGAFDEYPQVVLLTGHTHAQVASPKTIYQKDYTVLQSGAIAYTSLVSNTKFVAQPGTLSGNKPEGYDENPVGFICEINKKTHELTVHRKNFKLGISLNSDIVIKSYAKESFEYTDARKASDPKPTFAAGTEITVEKDVMSATKYNAYLTLSAASHPDYVEYYKVIVSDGDTEEEYWLYTDFFIGVTKMKKSVELYIPLLSASKDYTLTVSAVSGWGTESDDKVSTTIARTAFS